jgi:hypothetical protein
MPYILYAWGKYNVNYEGQLTGFFISRTEDKILRRKKYGENYCKTAYGRIQP